MSETRSQRFESNIMKLPEDLDKHISEYIPIQGNTEIAKYDFESNTNRDAYTGLKDKRYNDLPEYQKDLALKLWRYGIFEQVKYTLDRWYSKDVDQNWDKFIKNYPFGNGISPYAIKDILEKEKWLYIGGKRFIKMRTKRRISRKRNTKKRRSKK